MNGDQLINEALMAHEAALEAQAAMGDLARERDTAVRKALGEGAEAIPLAEALGVTRQQIYTMARNA